MTSSTSTPNASTEGRVGRSGRARQKRGEGQWALGYNEPLNKNEQSKKDDNPLNVRARILNIYSKKGFASIDPADLRGRFRWMGLYTQRAPGFDGGKTAMLEEEELDDEFFMLRVRSDGELLDAAKLRALGSISTDFARGTADITDRQNIQYHWIEVENVPEIWERLDNVGMTSVEACGDSPRPFLGSPVAGVSSDEIIDATPALEEIKRRYIGDPRYSNLPRKFKTSASGHPSLDCVPSVNDVSFVGTVHPEHGPGFDLWVGGGLSTNPMLAQKLGVWIPLDEVADAWEGVVSVFRDYGYRRLRSRARLKFLVADWGVEKFREILETEYLKKKLVDCPSPEATQDGGDHIGVHPQKDGKFYIGVAPVAGRVNGATLTGVGDLVEKYAAAGARLTAAAEAGRARASTRPTSSRSSPTSPRSTSRRVRPTGAGRRWPAPASSSASWRSSRPSSAPSTSWTSWSSASPSSTPRSASTSTAAPTPAPAPRSPTSASRACSCSTTTATRSRASRCTSVAPGPAERASARSCAATRSPVPGWTTT